MIVCAAVVGPQNNPLFLETYVPADDEAKFHCIVHCSLDAVEEKVLLRRAPGEVPDLYLGLLYPTEEYRVYGHTKFVLVLDEFSPREDLLTKVFKALHSAYVDAASNPFYTVGLPITAPSFAGEVAAVVRGYAQQLAQP
ncbi:Trafficking protein particle complex subunit 2-like protein [Monoraphidium neglectum]|uniref:Trafficking protein particle complex subunit 2-like protein n=1 Tax=Monoraphidium neglectum TaxID=145388 RepID=A0A0D2JDA8_9CHLO|nr:Trafficking protein particle complex subunit 2-like protein [Monoraphidium neglectum]KIY97577.1 Trafficking protein particle complex subunit 2-like protein [Monoraphidium neglectum]|eukprot:XP_013896597.1 Trafficking protein particle complex subunit 2-like protein [Monoraphidium neglectum]